MKFIAIIDCTPVCWCNVCTGHEFGQPCILQPAYRFQILEAETLEQAEETGPNKIELDSAAGEDLVSVKEYSGPLPAGTHGNGKEPRT